ncbi:hypothetical protein [Acaryochloris marina]|uniref:Uncharacterized protein n=1 Tax=Acaryochloris marina (strain MBIC 11017) TaxID=329726 RepID=B0C1Z7_ACAM1|nr:hypothetical protein [Acaryochloris marina]ABW27298.1 hypothetical protein AM1_2288 [Acaryochloris marina MBIC11017]BDM82043.1 hypothetical protein AM10699_49070 [Acaryochloris marina MBIC10699]
MLSPSLLHDLWQLIEELPSHPVMQLNDSRLISWLLARVERRLILKEEDISNIEKYLGSHVLLIREMTESRRYHCCPLAM